MMHVSLFFHPDARKSENFCVGSLVFGKTGEGWVYAQYMIHNGVEAAKAKTQNVSMLAMLNDLSAYVARQIEGTEVSEGSTEEQVFQKFVERFGYNLRMSDPRPWPDDLVKFIFEGRRCGAEVTATAKEFDEQEQARPALV